MDGNDREPAADNAGDGSDAENDLGTTSVGDEPRTPSPAKKEVHAASPIHTTTNNDNDKDDDDDDSLPDSDDESVHSDHAQDYYEGGGHNNIIGLDDDGNEVGNNNIASPKRYYSSNYKHTQHVVVSGGVVGHPGVGAAIIHSDDDDDDDDDDLLSDASSIHSLQSCEIVADISNYISKKQSSSSSAGKGREESYHYNTTTNTNETDDSHSYYSEDGSLLDINDDIDIDIDDDDDYSLGFPPGYITHLDELNELQNHNDGPLKVAVAAATISLEEKRRKRSRSINPSIIPSYFFCPLSRTIMKDPVITPDGNTYERRNILRSLILMEVDPKSGNPLEHMELVEDYLVKQAIDKARKESWIRYVVEFKDEDTLVVVGMNDGAGMKNSGEEQGDNCGGGGVGLAGIAAPTTVMNGVENSNGVDDKGNEDQDKNNIVSITSADPDDYEELAYDNNKEEGGYNKQQQMKMLEQAAQSPQTNGKSPQHQKHPDVLSNMNSQEGSSSIKSPSSVASPSSIDGTGGGMAAHGWSVPLGVHKITCASPGLAVTADVHRRSNAVKRKIIKKSLVDDGSTANNTTKNNGDGSSSRMDRIKNMKRGKKSSKKKKRYKNIKTTTSVVTRDLLLPPGSHVEILETHVHGGRVRGRIVWEEEVTTEMDRELTLLLEEEEVRKRAMAKPTKSSARGLSRGKYGRKESKGSSKAAQQQPPQAKDGNKRRHMFFRRKSSTGIDTSVDQTTGNVTTTNPFASDLFDNSPPHHGGPGRAGAGGGRGGAGGNKNNHHQHHGGLGHAPTRSPSPLTTIKYNGWISLQWAGHTKSHEREEAIRKRRNARLDPKAVLVADEDDGPWTQPLPLGVYRIGSGGGSGGDPTGGGVDNTPRGKFEGSLTKQLPLYDAPDGDSNITDFLVCNQCLEIVETQVVVMKKKKKKKRNSRQMDRRDSMDSSTSSIVADHLFTSVGPEGTQVVRARCMVPVIVSPLSAEHYAHANSIGVFKPTVPQRKFRSGWITLHEGGADNASLLSSSGGGVDIRGGVVTANPIPIGAYIVTTNDPLLSCDTNAKIKSILPAGSVSSIDLFMYLICALFDAICYCKIILTDSFNIRRYCTSKMN